MTDTRTTIPTAGMLVVVTCWCGVQHAIPSAMNDWASESKTNAVHCPLGHKWVRREDNGDKLQAATARTRHLEDQLLAAGQEAERIRVALVRDRHRFANGVCPCCNRSFEALRRHIQTQHPDYDPAHLEAKRYACSCGREFETPRGLAIHAATRWSDRGADNHHIHLEHGRRMFHTDLHVVPMPHAELFPTGAVIAIAELVDSHSDTGCCRPWGESTYEEAGGRTRTVLHHLVLEHAQQLTTPLPARGALGLWTPDADLLHALGAVA